MFKKGCFELGATIYPVVIKVRTLLFGVMYNISLSLYIQYHREFADPYWNSQEQGMLTYLAMLMTSWAIVCDVDYLKPTSLQVRVLDACINAIIMHNQIVHVL